jgi:acetoin utilization deacetylase AcuC-like enzyme
MQVTEKGFVGMSRRLLAVAHECCSGRCVATLEGGYNLNALSLCVGKVLEAMATYDDDAFDAASDPGYEAMANGLLSHVVSIHADAWKI